jgi:uncharacterized protein (TIGR02266 family)
MSGLEERAHPTDEALRRTGMLDEDTTTELDAVKVGDHFVARPRESVPRVDPHAKTCLDLPSPARRSLAPSGAERRVASRVRLEADVSLYSATTFWAGVAEDLSEGGLFVATYQLEPIGTAMDLRFELPTGQAIAVRGVVRWVREVMDEGMPGMGIQFHDLTAHDLAVIKSFVKHRPPLLWDTDSD